MSKDHRRGFLKSSAAVTVGFMGLRQACHPNSAFAAYQGQEQEGFGYGRLYSDPMGILDLPEGFSYQVISKVGEEMDDGLVVPGAPDGMAAFFYGI